MGELPDSLPFFAIPNFPLNMESLMIILPYAIALIVVGLLESLMTATIVDELTDTKSDKNRECKGQGVANIIAGFFGGMAGCAMIGRYGQSHFEQSSIGVGHKVEGVIRSLETPILVVVKPFKEPKKVMLAFDGSASSQKVITYVTTSKLFIDSDVHLVHVGKTNDEFEALWSKAQNDLRPVCKSLDTLFLEGEVSSALSHYQADQKIDLTVMGAFGHHWLRNFLIGSTTSQMLNTSSGALLLVR